MRGKLERAEREWLHTNGAGSYAMSTVALMHTRRHHGLLVAALDPPVGRHVILSHAECELEVGNRTYRLAAHRFPNIAPMPGYRLLERFSQDPLPRWTYRIGKARLERTLCLARGSNALVLGFTYTGSKPAKLTVRPLMPLRPMSGLTHEHGGMLQRVSLKHQEVELQPVASVPPIAFRHSGLFIGSPEWWRRFEYSDDLDHNAQEDLWTPGVFEIWLEPRKTAYVVVAMEQAPDAAPEDIVAATREHLLSLDPGEDRPSSVRRLFLAADQFCVDACARPAIITGYPWFGAWVRDTCMALPGLLLTRGRVDSFKTVLRTLLESMRDGLLPRRLGEQLPELEQPRDSYAPPQSVVPKGFGRREFSFADATLWLFQATRALLAWTGHEDEFVREELFPALRESFEAIRRGRKRYGIWLCDDGLVANGADESELSRIDTQVGHATFTQQHPVAVELQPLWTRGCELVADLADTYGETRLAAHARAACERARASFRARFWNEKARYPYASISEEVGGEADDSIRPHAIIALSLDRELFETWQATAIVERVRRELLTPRGIRSLTPKSPDYLGHFHGTTDERERAFYSGAAWIYLLGFYARAALQLAPEDFEVQTHLRELVESALEGSPVLGQVSQLGDGDEPFRPAGAPAQAVSVATLLWILAAELGL